LNLAIKNALSIFNFGGNQDYDPLTFPPLLSDNHDTLNILEHRGKLEALASLIEYMANTQVLTLLTMDAKDSLLNGLDNESQLVNLENNEDFNALLQGLAIR